MVPEQVDHSPSDGDGVAAGGSRTQENRRSDRAQIFSVRKHSGCRGRPTKKELLNFVNPGKIPLTSAASRQLRAALRPLGLGYWLERYETVEAKECVYGVETAVSI